MMSHMWNLKKTICMNLFTCTRSSNQQKQARKKGIQIGKEDVKLSVFADNIILYTENPKEYTHTIIRANNFRKDAGYKINMKK